MPDARSPGYQHVDHSTAGRDLIVAHSVNQVYVPGPSSKVVWPLVVGVPPQVADSYQARRELAELLRRGFDVDGSTVLGQVAAAGMGGVGKTQQAVNIFESSAAQLRVWVTATSRDTIVATYADAASRIGASGAGDLPEQAATRFVEDLSTLDRSWLVVLDDVSSEDDLTGLIPRSSSGTVLVTTRRRHLDIGPTQWINVDVFTPKEAHGYLEQALTDPEQPRLLDEAETLASDLGYLPLALSHATAVIRYEGITCGEYRRRFADRAIALSDLLPQRPPGDYGYTIATTWTLAIDHADTMHPVGLARPALQIAAVLDPNGTPDKCWTTSVALEFAATHRRIGPDTDDPVDAEALRRALRNLHHLHLLTHHVGAGPQAVRMHALVQRAVADPLSDEELTELVCVAADALIEAWPDPENNLALSHAMRSNAVLLASRSATALWDEDAHPVLLRIGRSLGETGLVAQASDYFSDLTEASIGHLGFEHPDTLKCRHHLADWRGQTGDASGAVAALEGLLADSIRVLGPDHPDTLATRHDLARWRGLAGDPRGAATELQALLADSIRVLGPDHPDTLGARHNVANWRGQSGDPRGAAAALEGLLVDCVRVLGSDHLHTLATRHAIARWHGEAGDVRGAAGALEGLLVDYQRVLGDDHPHTLAIRHAIANWRGESGEPERAAAALETLLLDCVRVLGSDHPNTLATRHTIAYWRGQAGDPHLAVSAFDAVLIDYLRVLGPDHPDTLATRRNMAFWRDRADTTDQTRI